MATASPCCTPTERSQLACAGCQALAGETLLWQATARHAQGQLLGLQRPPGLSNRDRSLPTGRSQMACAGPQGSAGKSLTGQDLLEPLKHGPSTTLHIWLGACIERRHDTSEGLSPRLCQPLPRSI